MQNEKTYFQRVKQNIQCQDAQTTDLYLCHVNRSDSYGEEKRGYLDLKLVGSMMKIVQELLKRSGRSKLDQLQLWQRFKSIQCSVVRRYQGGIEEEHR